MSKRGESVVCSNDGVWEGTEWLKESRWKAIEYEEVRELSSGVLEGPLWGI